MSEKHPLGLSDSQLMIDSIKKRLETYDINHRGEWGITILMQACSLNEAPLVKWLLDNGADPNARTLVNHTALNYAVNPMSNTEIIKLLLDRGGDYFAIKSENRELVYSAVYMGQYEALRLMEKAGAKILNEYDKSENLMDVALRCRCGDAAQMVIYLRDKGFKTLAECREEVRPSDHHKRLQSSPFYALIDGIYLDKKGVTLREKLLKWAQRVVKVHGEVMTNEQFVNNLILPTVDSKVIHGTAHRTQYLAQVKNGYSFYAIPKMVYELLPVKENYNR